MMPDHEKREMRENYVPKRRRRNSSEWRETKKIWYCPACTLTSYCKNQMQLQAFERYLTVKTQ